jgi:electron transport complex protein RnfC
MRIFGFKGGVHPAYNKAATESKAIRDVAPPGTVYIPAVQHIGAPGKVLVKKGDEVKKGTVVAEPGGFVSTAIHATVSGKVRSVEELDHPLGMKVPTVVIQSDGADEWAELRPVAGDPLEAGAEDLKAAVKSAGIVGLGGATFPSHVKLSPPPKKKIDTFILNGCECEPYLTADHRLMVEEPEGIVMGMLIGMRILDVKSGFIGIEANKPDAVEAMAGAVAKVRKSRGLGGAAITVATLPVKYPQGAEKQLIRALLRREVPSGGLPMDVGALVHNVGTVLSIFQAVTEGRPLIDRVVTASGSGIKNPGNYRVRVGMLIRDFVAAIGGWAEGAHIRKLIMGGPMMGMAQFTDEVPIIKGTSGILAFTDREYRETSESSCIRCGRCVSACPMNLNPTFLARLSRLGIFDHPEGMDSLDCIECGCCAFECPAGIPLVHYLKRAKARIMELRKKAG